VRRPFELGPGAIVTVNLNHYKIEDHKASIKIERVTSASPTRLAFGVCIGCDHGSIVDAMAPKMAMNEKLKHTSSIEEEFVSPQHGQ
jgi:hypothetical protein